MLLSEVYILSSCLWTEPLTLVLLASCHTVWDTWMKMIYDIWYMDGRTMNGFPLTQSHMDNLLWFYLCIFALFSNVFMCGVNLLNFSCSQKNSSEIYFHLFKSSPIPPNVHLHFWVNYTFKNTGVSEKLERGDPQQINRTGWEHSLGQTHIYPVS